MERIDRARRRIFVVTETSIGRRTVEYRLAAGSDSWDLNRAIVVLERAAEVGSVVRVPVHRTTEPLTSIAVGLSNLREPRLVSGKIAAYPSISDI